VPLSRTRAATGRYGYATEFERVADLKIENWTLPIRPRRR
jgi:hypothetical protein